MAIKVSHNKLLLNTPSLLIRYCLRIIRHDLRHVVEQLCITGIHLCSIMFTLKDFSLHEKFHALGIQLLTILII